MGDGHSIDFLFFAELHLQRQTRSYLNETVICLLKSHEGQKSGSNRLKNFVQISPLNFCSDILNGETFAKETYLGPFSRDFIFQNTVHSRNIIHTKLKISHARKFILFRKRIFCNYFNIN